MNKTLEALRCEPCEVGEDCGPAWARVWTVRGDRTHVSELSWPLARRLLPTLLARYGKTGFDLAGLFHGRCILIRTA